MKRKVFKISGLILIGLALSVAGSYFLISWNLPNVNEISLSNIAIGQSTKIYDRTGKILLAEINPAANRIVVSADAIPAVTREATVSIEDKNFYNEPAFDWKGIARAVLVDIIHHQPVEGGSTITQQLARNLFLTDQKSLIRKAKELILAFRLERRYSKDQILNTYLNYVAYGTNIYGVERAAKSYFGIEAKDLTLNEAATLAAIPQSPNYYSPWGSHLSDLEARKNIVLRDMLNNGYITRSEFQAAGTTLPTFLAPPQTGKAPHFTDYVEGYLIDKYGESAVQNGGLRVTTTLDWNLQRAAEEAIKNGVARDASLYNGQNGALVAEDPKTGQILAMVGSKDYYAAPYPAGCVPGKNCEFEGQFNVATQGLRQPGSALKPFVYLTAFEEDGLTPDTVLWDVPTEFATNNPNCPPLVNLNNTNSQCYHPRDFEKTFAGPVSVKSALAESINVPAVKALYLVGIPNAISTLDKFGITSLDNRPDLGLSLVLGGGDVRLMSLVNAYATLADNGLERQPSTVLGVEDNAGNVLEQYQNQSSQVVDPNYAQTITSILSSADLRAPLFGASLNLTTFPGYEVALKTGTTNNYVDAWAMGYTPDLAVGVWAGNNNNQPLKSQGSSILAAVPMWHDFLSQALKQFPADTFTTPSPLKATNSVLQGYLVKGEFHNILYYLGRTNDPEFLNWETGVQSWLGTHSVDASLFPLVDSNQSLNVPPPPAAQNAPGQIEINLVSPANGQFISTSTLEIKAAITSANPLSKVEIYLNNNLIDGQYLNLGRSLNYDKTLTNLNLEPQNSLVLRATDETGYGQSQTAIFYEK